MMSEKQVALYIAVSLDGYIADENGSVEWLESIDSEGGMRVMKPSLTT